MITTTSHINHLRITQLSTRQQLMIWLRQNEQAWADAEFEGGLHLLRYCLSVEEHQEPTCLSFASAYWNWYCRLRRIAQEAFVQKHISDGTPIVSIPHLYYKAMMSSSLAGKVGTPGRDMFWTQYEDMVHAVEIEWKRKK